MTVTPSSLETGPFRGPARVRMTGCSVELATARGLGRGKRSEPNRRGVAKAWGRACSLLLACPDQGPGLGAPQQQSCGEEKVVGLPDIGAGQASTR